MIGNGSALMDVNGNHRLLVGPRQSGGSPGMTSPTPSTAHKMANGVRHHQHVHPGVHQQQQYVHHQLNTSKVSHQGPQSPQLPAPMQTTPTLVIKPQALDLSVRDLYLHDTSSQELSRSALSCGGPRLLRTPNQNLTPTLAGGTNAASSVATTSNATATFPPFNLPTSNPVLPSDIVARPSDAVGSVKELLGSLALLSVISAIVAFLAVLFLTRIMVAAAVAPQAMPCNGGGCILHIDAAEYRLVYEVIIGLTACTISLDFTCLLICCAQFMFTSKLMKSPHASERAGQYLRQSSFTRIIAVGGFFISIPVLLTGIILHAFVQFEAKPAIITSTLLGVSIIFCGLAMIHNVYVWQREKTKMAATSSSRSPQAVVSISSGERHDFVKAQHSGGGVSGGEQPSGSPGMDTTQNVNIMELSTLV